MKDATGRVGDETGGQRIALQSHGHLRADLTRLGGRQIVEQRVGRLIAAAPAGERRSIIARVHRNTEQGDVPPPLQGCRWAIGC